MRDGQRINIFENLRVCVDLLWPAVSMNGDMPHVPITTLAGIAGLTDCKYTWHTLVYNTEHSLSIMVTL